MYLILNMFMEYNARKFNQESYDINDAYAKDKFKEFLLRNGYKVTKDVEDFEHDIVATKNEKTYYFELEVKHHRPFKNRESFQFPTVSFLGRKLRLHTIKPFIYVIICKETEWMVICNSNDIYKDDYIETLNIDTSHRQGKDQFFRVPKENCDFVNLN